MRQILSKKLIIIIFLLLSGVFVFSIKQFIKGNTLGRSGKLREVILYYGVTCPHCKIVERWLDNNPNIKEKSGLETKEVYQSENNSKELVKRAAKCQIDESSGVGVPFLYDNGQCIVGDQPIIDYLKEKYR